MRPTTALLLTLASLPAQGQVPEMMVSRADGTQVVGRIVALRPAQLELKVGADTVAVPIRDLLAVHGALPRTQTAALARLVGGDELRGDPRPGDPGGETFVLESRSLGPMAVPVDRLQALLLAASGDTDPGEFVLPADGAHEEALFVPARRGFDSLFGSIHRFAADGVVFAVDGAAEPRTFAFGKLAAVALRNGVPAAKQLGAVLVTRAGDCITVDVADGDATSLRVDDERGRRLVVPWTEVASLLWRGADRVFLSELVPSEVAEAAALNAGQEPLYRWRADRNVRGGFLCVGGRCYARGLGVHSRSTLTFTVPDGCTALCLAVGIDDEVTELAARGDADVTVSLDGKVVASRQHVRSGEPAVNLGRIPVRAGAKLTLTADFGAGLDLGDRVDWLHAVLLKQP